MMPVRSFIRLLVAVLVLVPALSAVALAQSDADTVVIADDFDDPAAGVLQEGSDDPDLRFDYDDGGYEIDAFADDFAGDLTVPVPGEFPNGTIAIDASLTGRNDSNGHYLFLACRVRDETGYKFEIRPIAQVAAIWLLSPDGNQRIANVGLDGDPSSGPFRIEFTCDGDQLTGRIDGEEIVSVTDGTYDQGSFAFGAGVYRLSAGRVSADFDNLTVSVPASEAPATPDVVEDATPAPTEEPAVTPEPEAPAATPEPEATVAATPVPDVADEPIPSQAGLFDRAGLAAAATQLRDRYESQAPVSGPDSGQTDATIAESVTDFVASTSFTVPEMGVWSAGYAFRSDGVAPAIVLVSSNGAWMLTAGTEQVRAAGLVDAIETEPGARNTIELITAGGTGYLAVNGTFVAQLDIAPWPEAGTLLAIGSAGEDGSPLEFVDATVWVSEQESDTGLTPEAVASPAAEATPEPERGEPTADATPDEGTAPADDARATFESIMATATESEPLSGPDAGTLTQAIGALDIASAGVLTENFYSSVRFTNPASADDPNHPWDIVVGFWHAGGDDQVRLVIVSDGTWSLALGTARPILSGEVGNLNLGPARGNDIELAVLDGVGYLGVNGEFVASFEIPSEPRAGDLWLASGTFPENAQEGVETPFSDWTIWSLERG